MRNLVGGKRLYLVQKPAGEHSCSIMAHTHFQQGTDVLCLYLQAWQIHHIICHGWGRFILRNIYKDEQHWRVGNHVVKGKYTK